MLYVRDAYRRGQQPKLLAHVRDAIRARHYSIRVLLTQFGNY